MHGVSWVIKREKTKTIIYLLDQPTNEHQPATTAPAASSCQHWIVRENEIAVKAKIKSKNDIWTPKPYYVPREIYIEIKKRSTINIINELYDKNREIKIEILILNGYWKSKMSENQDSSMLFLLFSFTVPGLCYKRILLFLFIE